MRKRTDALDHGAARSHGIRVRRISSSFPVLAAVVFLLAAGLMGCGDDGAAGAGGGGAGGSGSTGSHDANDDVIYEGAAQHDALEELLAATPVEDAAQGATFDQPADGAALDPAAPLTFTWTAGAVPRHGDPVNGPAYLLVFATDSEPALLRVFTTEETYTPDADAWATVTGAGAPVTVTVTTALFEQNRVAQGGGPWIGPPITLGG